MFKMSKILKMPEVVKVPSSKPKIPDVEDN